MPRVVRLQTSTTAWNLFPRRCYAQGGSNLWSIAKLLLQFCADPDANFQEGVRTVERLRGAKTFIPRVRNVEVTASLSARVCLLRCCNGSAELDAWLDAAKKGQSEVWEQDVARNRTSKQPSVLQKLARTFVSNLTTSQRKR